MKGNLLKVALYRLVGEVLRRRRLDGPQKTVLQSLDRLRTTTPSGGTVFATVASSIRTKQRVPYILSTSALRASYA